MYLHGNLSVFESCHKIVGLSSPPASVSPIEGQACVTMYGLKKSSYSKKLSLMMELVLVSPRKLLILYNCLMF